LNSHACPFLEFSTASLEINHIHPPAMGDSSRGLFSPVFVYVATPRVTSTCLRHFFPVFRPLISRMSFISRGCRLWLSTGVLTSCGLSCNPSVLRFFFRRSPDFLLFFLRTQVEWFFSRRRFSGFRLESSSREVLARPPVYWQWSSAL